MTQGKVISWQDLERDDPRPVPFLIDPYIPRESIVFMFGDTSIGKSPFTWHMAKSVGDGIHFFGLPVTHGRVLYIEVDTPEVVVQPRIKKIPAARDVTFFIYHGNLNIPNMDGQLYEQLVALEAEIKPDLVFVNTLVKAHDLDDKEPKTPSKVYGYFQALFPRAALVFVHHVRKSPVQPGGHEVARESFSGSKHWLDDAQVGLFLQPYRARGEGVQPNLRLYHVKSQASQRYKPLPLLLGDDGSSLSSPLFDELLVIYNAIHEWTGGKSELDFEMHRRLGISVGTAKERRLLIEHGKFPNTSDWLGRDDG